MDDQQGGTGWRPPASTPAPGPAPASTGGPAPTYGWQPGVNAPPVPAAAYGPVGYPGPGGVAVRPVAAPVTRAEGGLPTPVAFEAVPGTPFAVAIVGVPATTSGPASGSLIAGVGSILVTLVVGCFAALGAQGGWGPVVSGAFALLAGFAGVAAVVLSQIAMRQFRRAPGRVTGRGVAVAGFVCGLAGLVLTALAFATAVVLARTPAGGA